MSHEEPVALPRHASEAGISVDLLPDLHPDAWMERRNWDLALQEPALRERARKQLELYKFGTLMAIACKKDATPRGVYASSSPEKSVHADETLWLGRVGRLKPVFRGPFGRRSVGTTIARNILGGITEQQLEGYERANAEHRRVILETQERYASIPVEERSYSAHVFLDRAPESLQECDESAQMDAALRKIPGFFDLSRRYREAKDEKVQEQLQRELEQLLSE